jgi:hypothetical protein
MRRLLIALALVLVVALSVLSVWVAWPRATTSVRPGLDLDAWEVMSQQYHRALPTGKQPVQIRLPGGLAPRQLTYSVTVNGSAP